MPQPPHLYIVKLRTQLYFASNFKPMEFENYRLGPFDYGLHGLNSKFGNNVFLVLLDPLKFNLLNGLLSSRNVYGSIHALGLSWFCNLFPYQMSYIKCKIVIVQPSSQSVFFLFVYTFTALWDLKL